MRKEKIYFDEWSFTDNWAKAFEVSKVFKEAKNELEEILQKPIKDFGAFKTNPIEYAKEAIKEANPKVFALGLSDENTLKMLSINLNNLERLSNVITRSPYAIIVTEKGEVSPDENKEPFTIHAEKVDELERYDFCLKLIEVIKEAYKQNTDKPLRLFNAGFMHLIIWDVQTESYIPNWQFVKGM